MGFTGYKGSMIIFIIIKQRSDTIYYPWLLGGKWSGWPRVEAQKEAHAWCLTAADHVKDDDDDDGGLDYSGRGGRWRKVSQQSHSLLWIPIAVHAYTRNLVTNNFKVMPYKVLSWMCHFPHRIFSRAKIPWTLNSVLKFRQSMWRLPQWHEHCFNWFWNLSEAGKLETHKSGVGSNSKYRGKYNTFFFFLFLVNMA